MDSAVIIVLIFIVFLLSTRSHEGFRDKCATYTRLSYAFKDNDWRSIYNKSHGLPRVQFMNDSSTLARHYFNEDSGFFKLNQASAGNLTTLRKQRGGIRCTYKRPTYMSIVFDSKHMTPQLASQFNSRGWREQSNGDGNWRSVL
jgi:hypothetical protein